MSIARAEGRGGAEVKCEERVSDGREIFRKHGAEKYSTVAPAAQGGRNWQARPQIYAASTAAAAAAATAARIASVGSGLLLRTALRTRGCMPSHSAGGERKGAKYTYYLKGVFFT